MRMRVPQMLYKQVLSCLALSVLALGCEQNFVELGNSQHNALIEPGRLVCDPFTQLHGAEARSGQGWVGQVGILPAGSAPMTGAMNYRDHADKLDATLFLGSLDIPTRAFDLGFMTRAGETLKTPQGDTLYEYFSLHLESAIEIPDTQAAGQYQFALLADDGAVLSADVDGSGVFRKIVDNDGTHATKLVVSSTPVTLAHGQRLPIKIDYYQGPRYHIALMLLWRPWTADSEPLNGRSGNSVFFDSTVVPSAPLAAFDELKTRGWSVVPTDRFRLPSTYASNPCVTTPPPVQLVSQFCQDGEFTAKGAPNVGLVIDPNEGSQASIVAALQNMGYDPRVYTPAQMIAGAPTADGVNSLFVARVGLVEPIAPEFGPSVRDYISHGGSVIAEYDGAAAFFSQAGQGDAALLSQIGDFWNFFTGIVDGGGLLVPRTASTLFVTDPTDAIMQGVPTSYLSGTKAAFGIGGFDTSWLRTSAEFSSTDATDWGPLARYPAVMSGRCNQGRVVLFTMSVMSSGFDVPIQQMTRNAVQWSVGQ